MFEEFVQRVRALLGRLRRAERRELREFRRWAETTDRLVHLSVLVFVPLLIGLVTLLSNAVPQLSFLLFPPLASGSYTLFVDPRGKYADPVQFVAGLTIGAACGLGALWVATAVLTLPSGQFQVAAGAAVLATLATGLITWPFDIEEPSAYSTALLALLVQPTQRLTFLGSIFLASSIVAVVFVVWRNRFYDRRATVLYESTTGDDHVLVPMRGEHAHATAMLGARLAAAHEAGKVVLLDIVSDTGAAETERAMLNGGVEAGTVEAGGVNKTDQVSDAVRERVERLESRAATIETRVGVPCQVVVATGEESAAATTLQAAESTNCDLIAAPYESEHGALTTYLRELFRGRSDVLVHRSRNGRTRWRRVLVPVRRASDVAHHMVDFAVRLAGGSGRVAVATCIGDSGDRRRAESMLADLAEPFVGDIETRVSGTDIHSFLGRASPEYDLVIIGASQDRSAASRFITPPTFERLDDLETDVAIVDRSH
ncbi:HPP family protein [Haloarcula salinisoli]|uniref:HPP family protein n=1 Tax=Haloarcula salinisoli TaxID=2487746 RepID=A0A8J7YN90_9EURY|nr:HPP family protein [Halomicroarcula salinisoli]MBX0304866.1 HPP family protein [Halomicroarcula salinisoli]